MKNARTTCQLLLIISVLFSIVNQSFAQKSRLSKNNYQAIDAHAKSAPKSVTQSVGKLATYLTKPAKSDFQRVRSFYVWLTHNIDYDVALLNSLNLDELRRVENAERELAARIQQTLKRRKAVCQGYSEVFNALCQSVGIKSRMISGYSKNNFTDEVRNTPNHAWNVVFIEGNWYLLDPTWGVGTLHNGQTFRKKFSNAFFLSNPKTFILRHLPSDPAWQLLDCPISFATFKKDEKTIQKRLQQPCTDDKRMDYKDILAKLERLSPQERALQSAENAYQFNKKNRERLGAAYLNYANHLTQEATRRKAQLSADELIERRKKVIKMQQKGARYLDPSQPNYQEAQGYGYLNYATALSSKIKGSPDSQLMPLFNKILKNLNIAKKFLSKGTSSQAKKALKNCNQNIKLTNQNIKLYKKQKSTNKTRTRTKTKRKKSRKRGR